MIHRFLIGERSINQQLVEMRDLATSVSLNALIKGSSQQLRFRKKIA